MTVSERSAGFLGINAGDTIEWNAYGKAITAKVVELHKTDMARLTGFVEFRLAASELQAFPTVVYGAVRLDPVRVAAFQRAAYERFPTVTVVNVADVMQRIEEVVDQITLVIRFISLFAIVAGATILASSIAGTRFRRLREVVILKTLGATRARIVRIFSVEFLVLGLVAGVIGSLLASGFAALLLRRFFETPLGFDWPPNLAAVILTVAIATATGWLASYRVLAERPLEVLRNE
jgi:putative ABC transport system permease protein